jgi:RNA polymerase sigma-70 factor (ECF subfamily)
MTVRAERPPTTLAMFGETDEQRFAAIHGRYCAGIWRYVRRLGLTAAEADDATQQVFIVVAQRLGVIRAESERSFVYEVASRVTSDLRRRASRRHEVEDTEDHAAEPGTAPDALLEERRRRTLLDSILAALPSDLRQVFVLFEIEELPMREIAEILRVPPGTVASRIRRAREAFQKRTERLRKEGLA